jgi:hypothetical protein
MFAEEKGQAFVPKLQRKNENLYTRKHFAQSLEDSSISNSTYNETLENHLMESALLSTEQDTDNVRAQSLDLPSLIESTCNQLHRSASFESLNHYYKSSVNVKISDKSWLRKRSSDLNSYSSCSSDFDSFTSIIDNLSKSELKSRSKSFFFSNKKHNKSYKSSNLSSETIIPESTKQSSMSDMLVATKGKLRAMSFKKAIARFSNAIKNTDPGQPNHPKKDISAGPTLSELILRQHCDFDDLEFALNRMSSTQKDGRQAFVRRPRLYGRNPESAIVMKRPGDAENHEESILNKAHVSNPDSNGREARPINKTDTEHSSRSYLSSLYVSSKVKLSDSNLTKTIANSFNALGRNNSLRTTASGTTPTNSYVIETNSHISPERNLRHRRDFDNLEFALNSMKPTEKDTANFQPESAWNPKSVIVKEEISRINGLSVSGDLNQAIPTIVIDNTCSKSNGSYISSLYGASEENLTDSSFIKTAKAISKSLSVRGRSNSQRSKTISSIDKEINTHNSVEHQRDFDDLEFALNRMASTQKDERQAFVHKARLSPRNHGIVKEEVARINNLENQQLNDDAESYDEFNLNNARLSNTDIHANASIESDLASSKRSSRSSYYAFGKGKSMDGQLRKKTLNLANALNDIVRSNPSSSSKSLRSLTESNGKNQRDEDSYSKTTSSLKNSTRDSFPQSRLSYSLSLNVSFHETCKGDDVNGSIINSGEHTNQTLQDVSRIAQSSIVDTWTAEDWGNLESAQERVVNVVVFDSDDDSDHY